MSTPLEALARCHGIALTYRDNWSQERHADADVLRALLRAMRVDASDDGAIERALAAHRRDQWQRMVPAYALVGYVSWVRVDTDHHRWRDIGAGVLLSMGVSMLFVTPADATHIAPIVGPDWLGMRIERSF